MKIADLKVVEVHEGRRTFGPEKGKLIVKMFVDARGMAYIVQPDATETTKENTHGSVDSAKRYWRIYNGGVRWKKARD